MATVHLHPDLPEPCGTVERPTPELDAMQWMCGMRLSAAARAICRSTVAGQASPQWHMSTCSLPTGRCRLPHEVPAKVLVLYTEVFPLEIILRL